jgi:hypothetical protein
MRRLRDLLDSEDPAVAELARLVRAVGDLDPPSGVQDRVRRAVTRHGLPAKPPGRRMHPAEQLIRSIAAVAPGREPAAMPPSDGARSALASPEVPTQSSPANTSWPLPVDPQRAAGPGSPSVTTLSGAVATSWQPPVVPAHRHRRSVAIVVAAAAAALTAALLTVAARSPDGDRPAVKPPSGGSDVAAGVPQKPPGPATAVPLDKAVAGRPSGGAALRPAGGPGAAEPGVPRSVHLPQGPRAQVEVTVESVPAGAQILRAGTVIGKTPFHGALVHRGGDVTLVVRLAGYLDRSLVIHPGRAVSEHIELSGVPPAQLSTQDRDGSINPFHN